MVKFPFTDLHSFKDYIVFVQVGLPNRFPLRERLGPDEQWTPDLAFEGLRYGLRLAMEKEGENAVFLKCQELVEEAYKLYGSEDVRGGFFKLEEVQKLLATIPSR
ncbi:MAG TPA: hypothetical protein VMD30_01325 [Tepidisphaeraceae bacterium]|nr:hypothetical protein [Tepidisphaeraceae bacterium]